MLKRTLQSMLALSVSASVYFALTLQPARAPETASVAVGSADVENVKLAYERWLKHDAPTSASQLSVGLLWNKALSAGYSPARGLARIDLESGKVLARIDGNAGDENLALWLADSRGEDVAIDLAAEQTNLIRVGSFNQVEDHLSLSASIDPALFDTYEVNWVIVAPESGTPAGDGVLFGSTSLFQRLYHFASSNPMPWVAVARPADGNAVAGILPAHYPNAELINEGRDIFFNETFDGNGRTCGTCHPEANNFALDPKFIAMMPNDDPLFIAERPQPNPLAENFEKPEHMRKLALIVENLDGFDDLENKFVLRSVPHMLSLRTTVSPPTDGANDGTTTPPDQRTGWSGDGSPTDLDAVPPLRGTLRDFTVGAIKQHFPLTLGREFGVDFRMPTERELDALEAFMLSLGRQEEFDDFTTIAMTDFRAERGRLNYMGVGVSGALNCNACHFNGGANTDPNFAFPAAITPPAFESTNRSFAPRGEELLDQPGDLIGGGQPFDDGFGEGTDLFNAPTVIEAADTGPFFHGNSIDTVEAMISFYSSKRHLRNGEVLDPIVELNGSQVANVGAFVRVLNADENARAAIELLDHGRQLLDPKDRRTNLTLALADIEDAIQVLEGGAIHFDDAVPALRQAEKLVRKRKWGEAMVALQQIREMMILRGQ